MAPQHVERARNRIAAALPTTYRGWPVASGRDGFAPAPRVSVDVWPRWLRRHLGTDLSATGDPLAWLLVPQQLLLGVVAGPVHHDPDDVLADSRRRVAWYPDDVWWWLLACQWRRLAQEEPFVQRTAEVGDDLGSAVLAARLVHDAVRLALLMTRRYTPYAKWLGSTFGRLEHLDGLDRHLLAALGASDAASREAALGEAYRRLAVRHAALPGASPLDPELSRYHDRPAMVLRADRFVEDCLRRVTDDRLLALPLVGSVDQLSDSTDLLVLPDLVRRARGLYGL